MASKSSVKCKYCEQVFNKEYTEHVKVSNRYAHKTCYDRKQVEIAERRKLTDFVKELYYPQEVDWGMIASQLERYKDAGMTYAGMYYTLEYFFVVKKNNIRDGKGVGIIPYMYDKARAYYKNMDSIYAKTAEIEQRDKIDVKMTEETIVITPKKVNKKLLDFSYED